MLAAMSVAPAERSGPALPPLPLPGAPPRDVRAALHPEHRAEFDRDYQAALTEAGQTLDLTDLHDVIEHWRRRSWITRDAHEHRRVVRRAAELITGKAPPSQQSVAATEAIL